MKHTEIEAVMTAKVAEYISKGYILSTVTMSGHQGEVTKVDLKKGDEIIRILLTSESSWDDEGTIQKTVLTIGKAPEKVRKSRPFDLMSSTIWNNRLDVIEETVWYSVDSSADNFSEDKAEIIEQHKKQISRYRTSEAYREMSRKDVTSEAAKAAVLPFVRRQYRCKSAKASDIVKIERIFTTKYSHMHYNVTVNNGKTYRLA